MKPRIFLNYAREDLVRVEELRSALAAAGFLPWMDLASIAGGEVWRRSIEREIAQSDFFVACLTPRSIARRGVVREEIEMALEVCGQRAQDEIFLIPVRLEACAIQDELDRFHVVDVPDVSALPRLLSAFHEGLRRRGVTILRAQPDAYLLEDDAAMLRRAVVEELRTGGRHVSTTIGEAGGKLLMDHSTGLTWQHGLSSSSMNFRATTEHIATLNAARHCGISAWRLPTLDEALSLRLCYGQEEAPFDDGAFWTCDTRGPIEQEAGMPHPHVWIVWSGGIPDVLRPANEARVKCVSSVPPDPSSQPA
jgi:hypothetical protein